MTREVDDATVEAAPVFERYECRICHMADDGPCDEGSEHEWLYTVAVPDPRPTEAEALQDNMHLLREPHAMARLRSLGCFRPEPAACYHGSECSGTGPDCGPAEPVPAAEPPTPGLNIDTDRYPVGLVIDTEPVPVPMVTVRREVGRHVNGGLTYTSFVSQRVPADQIPEGWEPADG